MTVRSTRRALLKSAVVMGGAMLAGCRVLKPRDPVLYCPGGSEVNAKEGRLTIDAHTHVFNGTDLPIEPFFRLVLARETGMPGAIAEVVGLLLQSVAWKVAPTAQAEMATIASIMPDIERCEGSAGLVLESRVNAMADAAHRRGVLQLRQALASPAAAPVRAKA